MPERHDLIRVVAEEPIACTLGADELEVRLAEWDRVLERATRRSIDGPRATLAFPAGDAALASSLADLTVREVGCCGFFDFRVHVAAGVLELDIAVPPDAAPVLADFASRGAS
jgi:hypothetical protein